MFEGFIDDVTLRELLENRIYFARITMRIFGDNVINGMENTLRHISCEYCGRRPISRLNL